MNVGRLTAPGHSSWAGANSGGIRSAKDMTCAMEGRGFFAPRRGEPDTLLTSATDTPRACAQAGTAVTVSWENPSGWTADYAQIHYSADGLHWDEPLAQAGRRYNGNDLFHVTLPP